MEKLKGHALGNKEQAYQPLLDEDSECSSQDLQTRNPSGIWRVGKREVAEIIYLSLSLGLILFLVFGGPSTPYSPANEVLEYELHKLWDGEESEFRGSPSDSVHTAWNNLLEPVNIRAYKHEYEKAQAPFKDAVQLVDDDYVAVLSVYHDLHCLNSIRRSLYPDYYWVNATDLEMEVEAHHLSHCVEKLRRTIMCKADVSMYSTYWIGDVHAIPNKQLRSEAGTMCVNWDKVETWAKQRLLPRDKFLLKPGPFEHL